MVPLTRRSRLWPLALTTAMLGLPEPAAAQERPLLAPVYPGAAPIPPADHDDLGKDRRFEESTHSLVSGMRSFLTVDPIDEVRAFYDAEVGDLQPGSLSYLHAPGMLELDPLVFARFLGRDANESRIGIEIRSREPRDERAPRNYDAVGPIFEKLFMGHTAGQATRQQFDAAVDQYKHLSWMFYLLTDERDIRGRRLSTDAVVVGGCQREAGGGMSPEEMAEKMQQLAAEGNLREMQQLAQQARGGGGLGTWDLWMGCLEKLEAVGYRTLITIPIRP